MRAQTHTFIRRAVPVSLVLALSFANAALAAGGWVAQNSGIPATLSDVDYGNGTLLAVGSSGGVVLSSINGGRTWVSVTSGVSNGLRAVDITDTNTAFAVGNFGTIIKSTDNGVHWATLTSGTEVSLNGIDMFFNTLGYTVGLSGTILKTANGSSWFAQTSGVTVNLWDIDCADINVCWAVGDNGTILKTSNGGGNWVAQTSGTTNSLQGVRFVNLSLGYAAGNNSTILKTTNGGTNWTPLTPPAGLPATGLREVNFFSATNGFIIGDAYVLTTADGGTSWSYQNLTGAYNGSTYGTLETDRWVVAFGGIIKRYDGVAPTSPTNLTVTTPTSDTTPTFTWIGSVDNETTVNGYEVSTDGGAFTDIGNVTSWTPSTAMSEGSHTFAVRAYDAVGNVSIETTRTVVVDLTPPTIPAVSPTSATVGVATTLSVSPTDSSGVSSCRLFVNSVDQGAMTASGATFQKSYTFASAGSYSVYANCTDAAGDSANGVVALVAATTAPAPDTIPPVVGTPSPASATVGVAVTLSASASDNVGVTSCNLWVNGADQGAMTVAGGSASKSYTFSAAGTYSVYVRCSDAAGNATSGAAATVTVSAAGGPDTAPPAVGTPSPLTAVAGSAVTISATATDNVGVTTCSLFINGVNQGAMTVSGGLATRAYTFGAAGTASVQVQCFDAAGNAAAGPIASVSVSTAPSGPAAPGSLIKIACPAGAAVDHPCKAVYYYGSDGKRHAFPNDKVYFTWYADFSSVVIVDQTFLASLPLGKNVVYRPGIKMVKFLTLNTVYAVSRYGSLRAIASEAVATSIYGPDWNRKIDDVSDAFFANYTFGAAINSAADYTPSAETAAVTTIDMNL